MWTIAFLLEAVIGQLCVILIHPKLDFWKDVVLFLQVGRGHVRTITLR